MTRPSPPFVHAAGPPSFCISTPASRSDVCGLRSRGWVNCKVVGDFCCSILVLSVCLGPLRLGLHCFSVDWGFSPLFLLRLVFVCDKRLFFVCVAFFVSCRCFDVRSETPAEGPLPFLTAYLLLPSLSVLVGLSSLLSACAMSASLCCPPCCMFWRLRVSSPLPSCCALLRGVFLLEGVRGGSGFCSLRDA